MAPAPPKAAQQELQQQARAEAGRAAGRPGGLLASITQPWLLAVILVLTTLGVYYPVHNHPFFTMDDDGYALNNPHLRSNSLGDTVRWAFTSYDLANWHPMTWLSHAADVRMFRSDPSGHHDVNLLLHIVNALLLFWVLLHATGYAGRSFMVAALFALHPINVETVAWIAERKNILSLFFLLLALGAYRRYAMKPQVGRYVAVAVLYALGLMAKPQVITFPFVLLLWDYWPLRRMFSAQQEPSGNVGNVNSVPPQKFSWLILEKLPLLALSLGSAVLTMRAQGQAGAMRYYPLSVRLGNAIVSYVRYIGKAFWPSRLAVFYTHPELQAGNVTAALLLLLAITAFVLYRRREGFLAVGWFWFLGTLVPMIGIVQVGEQAMADRYAYLSFIGLFIMVIWGVAELADQRHLSPAILLPPSAAVLLILAILTYRQLSYWSDNVSLWTHMLTISGGSYEVEENLGVALLDSGQQAPAMEHFQQVIALVPSSGAIGRELAGYAAVAHLYLGAYYQQHGQPGVAISHYEKVLSLAQDFTSQNMNAKVPPVLIRMKAAALGNMGDAYYALHNFADAKTAYESALQVDPRNAHKWIGLGIAEQRSGDAASAAQAFSRAAQLQPSDVTFLLLAQALDQCGHSEQAQAARQQASRRSQNLAAAQDTVERLVSQ